MEIAIKLGVLCCYFVVIAGVGIWSKKGTKTVGDFVTGGQSVSPARSAFSYAMTNFSAGIFLAFAGTVGWSYGIFGILIGLAASTFLGTYLPWKIMAKRIREATDGLPSATIPSYLESRFEMRFIRKYSSVLMFIFFIPYTASLLMGMSFLFEQVFGINYTTINVIMAIFVAFYLFLGGFNAVTMTDFIQGIVALVACVLIVGFVMGMPEVNGPIAAVATLSSIDPSLIVPQNTAKWIGVITMILATGLGPWGMPDMLQRFVGLDDPKSAKKGMHICVTISVVICVCACALGACGHLFFTELPTFNGKAGVDLIVPMIIAKLPAFLSSLFVVLILAASMSTMSGLALTAVSSVVMDLIKPIKPSMSEKTTMLLLRGLVVVFIAAALLISLNPQDAMLDLIQLTVGAIAGTFTGPLVWGLVSKKTTKQGVVAGMVIGIVIAICGYATLKTGALWLPEQVYGFIKPYGMPFFTMQAIIFPLIIVPIVSRLTYKEIKE